MRKLVCLSAVLALCFAAAMPSLPLLDFSLFWKAGENLLNGLNPYDAILLQEVAGSGRLETPPEVEALHALSSPVALGVLPFIGALSLETAKKAYLFFAFFSFFWGCLLGYWLFFRDSRSYGLGEVLLGIVILPLGVMYQVLAWGSMAVFCSLGLCGFMSCLDARREYWAGVFLSLCLIKPHLFVLFFVYLVWWSFSSREYKLILGLIAGSSGALAVALYFQPAVIQMYLQVYIGEPLALKVTNASLGNLLYWVMDRRHYLYMFAPCGLGTLALMAKLRLDGPWTLMGPLLCILPVSLVLAPYCWGHDYIVCLPLLFFAAGLIKESAQRGMGPRDLFLAVALGANAVIINIISPMFYVSWYFISYGVMLTILSWAVYVILRSQRNSYGRYSL